MRIQRVFLSSLRQSQFNTFHSTRYQLYCLDTGVIRWDVCLTYLHMNMQRNLNNIPLDLQDWSAASNIKPCASILQYVSSHKLTFVYFIVLSLYRQHIKIDQPWELITFTIHRCLKSNLDRSGPGFESDHDKTFSVLETFLKTAKLAKR